MNVSFNGCSSAVKLYRLTAASATYELHNISMVSYVSKWDSRKYAPCGSPFLGSPLNNLAPFDLPIPIEYMMLSGPEHGVKWQSQRRVTCSSILNVDINIIT